MDNDGQRATKRSKTEHTHTNGGQSQRQGGKRIPAKGHSKYNFSASASGIHHDDIGIFFTCDKGQERRCMTEFHDLLSQYIEADDSTQSAEAAKPDKDEAVDIEADIQAELNLMKPSTAREELIKMITLDIPCVTFARLCKEIEPVSLVHRICEDAVKHPEQKRSRYIKRMTPISLVRKTLSGGLEQLCEIVLKPHFKSGGPSKKFAIRPTIRNNNQLNRDTVIKTVATAVGHDHSVDLTNYDLLILVDVYRNVCGMSVVGNDYEKLKRYNLAEIYSPTPKLEPKVEPEKDEEVAKMVEEKEKDEKATASTS